MLSMQLSLKRKSFQKSPEWIERRGARRWHWAVTCSMPELLRPEMRGRQVKTGVWQEPRRRYWRPNAVSGENKSRTRAWSHLRSIQGRDHEDSDLPGRRVWNSRVLAQTASEAAAAVVSPDRVDGRRGLVVLQPKRTALKYIFFSAKQTPVL